MWSSSIMTHWDEWIIKNFTRSFHHGYTTLIYIADYVETMGQESCQKKMRNKLLGKVEIAMHKFNGCAWNLYSMKNKKDAVDYTSWWEIKCQSTNGKTKKKSTKVQKKKARTIKKRTSSFVVIFSKQKKNRKKTKTLCFLFDVAETATTTTNVGKL